MSLSDRNPGTPYHLSVALAKHIRVTYVNPPLSFTQWVRLSCQPILHKGRL